MYRKVDGDASRYTERVLFVKEQETAWSISGSTRYEWVTISGGQGKNSPASSEAGGSDSEGVSSWRCMGTEEGVSVTCIDE